MPSKSANVDSIKAVHKLLIDIISKPEHYLSDNELRTALVSQGALAKLARPELGICSMSLNTFKSACNQEIDGGYATIEACRMSALRTLELSPGMELVEPRSKRALSTKVGSLKHQVELYEKDLYNLSRAFWRAITEMRSIARRSKSQALIDECAEKEELLRAMASLVTRPPLEVVQ